MRTVIRLVLGTGLTAVGALGLREGWWPAAAAYGCLFVGSVILVVVGWSWLERDRDRLLRWSDEHRLRAFSRVSLPEARPVTGSGVDGPPPILSAQDDGGLPEQVVEVGVGPTTD
jgi:hypothetical protein